MFWELNLFSLLLDIFDAYYMYFVLLTLIKACIDCTIVMNEQNDYQLSVQISGGSDTNVVVDCLDIRIVCSFVNEDR